MNKMKPDEVNDFFFPKKPQLYCYLPLLIWFIEFDIMVSLEPFLLSIVSPTSITSLSILFLIITFNSLNLPSKFKILALLLNNYQDNAIFHESLSKSGQICLKYERYTINFKLYCCEQNWYSFLLLHMCYKYLYITKMFLTFVYKGSPEEMANNSKILFE